MDKIGIGLLGASGIAPAAIIAPAHRRDDVWLAAVASRRDPSEYARRHGIATAYSGYEALLADEDIDLVYIALPPSEHARWAIAALETGKDVLCEKPITMNAREAATVADSARETGHRVIEAFHDYYHPLQHWIRNFVAEGGVGQPTGVTAVFNGSNPFDPVSIRHVPELGGGALMDLGCYPVHWVRTLFGEPSVINATAERNPLGADLSIDASLEFAGGVRGRVQASMATGISLEANLHLEGTGGSLRVKNLVFPWRGHSIEVVHDGLEYRSTVAGNETYDHQLAAVVSALRTDEALHTEAPDYVNNMAAIDAIYSAAGIR